MDDDQKALSRGKYEFKKEDLRELKKTLGSQANEISEILRKASESPAAAYIENKRDLVEDALEPIAIPSESHPDQLISKTQTFVENVKRYQQTNKEAVELARLAS